MRKSQQLLAKAASNKNILLFNPTFIINIYYTYIYICIRFHNTTTAPLVATAARNIL